MYCIVMEVEVMCSHAGGGNVLYSHGGGGNVMQVEVMYCIVMQVEVMCSHAVYSPAGGVNV